MQGPFVTAPDDIDGSVRELPWFGDIATGYPEQLHSEGADTVPYPDARDIGRFALHHLELGESMDLTPIELSAHGHDHGSTAAALSGHSLLRPVPLYVRRPDAVEPS